MSWRDHHPLDDAQLAAKTVAFKERIEKVNRLIPPSRILCGDAGGGQTDTGRAALRCSAHRRGHPPSGKIAEMKTGEGKTLTSTLPAYLNGLSGKGVHLVTVND